MTHHIGRRLTTFVGLLTVLAASACGTSPDAGGANTGETLVVASIEQPTTIDPAKLNEKFGQEVLFAVSDRLVEFPPGSTEPEPALAESWEVSDDGLSYRFELREGVTFHDGSTFDAEDVVFSLERALRINFPGGAVNNIRRLDPETGEVVNGITNIEAPDPTTVVITIAAPDVAFIDQLTLSVATILPSDSDLYSMPPETLTGDDAAAQATEYLVESEIIGTGPYTLQEFQPGTSISLEQFDDYWREPAATPNVNFVFYDTEAQIKNALSTGEVDLNVNELGPTARDSIERDGVVSVHQGPGFLMRYIVLDPAQPPFDDPAVRRAVAAAVNREAISERVFLGGAIVSRSMIPPTYDVHQDYISDINIDAELGDRNEPVEFVLWYALNKYGDIEAEVAETIARSLNETGKFDVTIKGADWTAEFSQKYTTGAYGAFLYGIYPSIADPDKLIRPFYQSTGFIGLYSDPAMDKLVSTEIAESDETKRAKDFAAVQQKAAEDMPYVPLYFQNLYVYHADSVSNVEEAFDGLALYRWHLIEKQE